VQHRQQVRDAPIGPEQPLLLRWRAGWLDRRMENNIIMAAIAATASCVVGQSTYFHTQPAISLNAPTAHDAYAADLDGDGDLDVLAATWGDEKLSLYANDGNGGFLSPQVIDTNIWFHRVYAVDLDNDGDLDVIGSSAIASHVFAYYINDGTGNFGSRQAVTVGNGGAWAIHAADVDGDSDLDLIIAGGPRITVYPNDGSGGFPTGQTIAIHGSLLRSVHAADLDQDGDLDIVAADNVGHANGSGSVVWFANDGAGNFGSGQIIEQHLILTEVVQTADLDGDGDMDVLAGAWGGYLTVRLVWYANDGAGNFGTGKIINATHTTTDAYAVDIDGDGDLDVLSSALYSNVPGGGRETAWHENNGAGNFSPRHVIGKTLPAWSCHAADLDGDGDVDALASANDKFIWYANTSTPPTVSQGTRFGSSCYTSPISGNPPMRFRPLGSAIPGHDLRCSLDFVPTELCMVALGTSNSQLPGGGALPIDLSSIGMTGCSLYQSSDLAGLPTTDATWPGSWNLDREFRMVLPPSPLLVGKHLYLQGFSLAPGENALGVVSSNGIDFLIGNQ